MCRFYQSFEKDHTFIKVLCIVLPKEKFNNYHCNHEINQICLLRLVHLIGSISFTNERVIFL